MRVRVVKEFTAYWDYAITTFHEGAELEGEQARHMLDNAPEGSIDVLEKDPEPAPALKEPAAEPKAPAEGDGPPVDGTIDDLMSWVDGDPERASRALEAEQAKDKPRSTVVKRLTAMAGTDSEE
jgi:hypothetical protein